MAQQKSLIAKLVGVGVAIAVALGVSLAFSKGGDKIAQNNAPEIGNCLKMSGTPSNADHDEIDCDKPTASYKVVADKGGCDTNAEVNYTISSSEKDEGNIADLCLVLNVAEGDCISPPTAASFAAKIPCADAAKDPSAAKVVSVGKAADTCADGTQPVVNTKRDTVICLGPAA